MTFDLVVKRIAHFIEADRDPWGSQVISPNRIIDRVIYHLNFKTSNEVLPQPLITEGLDSRVEEEYREEVYYWYIRYCKIY